MSDLKSKLPDLKELGEITGKLFKDIKTSVSEIITNYKEKHPPQAAKTEATTEKAEPKKKPAAKTKAPAEAKDEGKSKE